MTTAEQARLLGDDRAPQNALAVGAAPESRPAPRGISPLSPSAPLPSGRDSIDDTPGLARTFEAARRRRRRLMRDVLTLSIGVALTFVAYCGAQQIETTLYPGVGSAALGTIYLVFAAGSLVAPAVVKQLGLKFCIVLQLAILTGWVAANVRPPTKAVMLPVSALAGFFGACFWISVPTYIALAADVYDNALAPDPDDGEKPRVPPAGGLCRALSATGRLIVGDARATLMVPLFIYVGVEQGFIFGIFGAEYVAPLFGDGMVGTISVAFGAADAAGSLLLGSLTDYCGWQVPLAIGMMAQFASLAVIVAWQWFGWLTIEDNPTGEIVMMAVATGWGIGDAALNVVVVSMIGTFFPAKGGENDGESKITAAFGNQRLWSSLFTAICFFGLKPLRKLPPRTKVAVECFAPIAIWVVAVLSTVALHFTVKARAKADARKAATCSVNDEAESGSGDSSGAEEGKAGKKNIKSALGRFNGVFFVIFQLSQIPGNVLSGVILGGSGKTAPQSKVTLLFLVYTGFGVTGVIVLLALLRRIPR